MDVDICELFGQSKSYRHGNFLQRWIANSFRSTPPMAPAAGAAAFGHHLLLRSSDADRSLLLLAFDDRCHSAGLAGEVARAILAFRVEADVQ